MGDFLFSNIILSYQYISSSVQIGTALSAAVKNSLSNVNSCIVQ